MHWLRVIREFGDRARGDVIKGAAEIERILGSELAHHVVKVPAEPEPATSESAPAAPAAAKAPARPKSGED